MNNADFRDKAYQFFIAEAPELLQTIESGLLSLRQENGTSQIHEIMRAAHSLKGGAAIVNLEAIKSIAHRLEDILKVFYNGQKEIDDDLESLLLRAYDCLHVPLMEKISTGSFDEEKALATAEPIFSEIEEILGDSLNQADGYVPGSQTLGTDIVASIFEVDVTQSLESIATMLDNPEADNFISELKQQVQILAGFAELTNLPGFAAIATAAQSALDAHPEAAADIAQIALLDFYAAQQSVLAGDRTEGGSPSEELLALAEQEEEVAAADFSELEVEEDTFEVEFSEADLVAGLDELEADSPIGLDKLATDLIAGLDEAEIDLVAGLDELEANLAPGLDEAEIDLVAGLDELEANLAPGLDQAEIDLVAGLDELEANLAPGLDQAEVDLVVGLDELETDLVAELDELEADLATGSDELDVSQFPDLELADAPLEGGLLEDLLDEVFSESPSGEEINLPEAEIFTPIALAPEDLETSTPTSIVGQSATDLAAETAPFAKTATSDDWETTVPAVEEIFAQLPFLRNIPNYAQYLAQSLAEAKQFRQKRQQKLAASTQKSSGSQLTVRVDFNRLENMNDLVGGLVINRNGLALHSDQIQSTVKELQQRFLRFQELFRQLRKTARLNAYQELITSTSYSVPRRVPAKSQQQPSSASVGNGNAGKIELLLQGLQEEMMQLEEAIEDINLFTKKSHQKIDKEGQMLTHLRDELMWARMLPLGEILNRFPRMLRDFSTKYQKPVRLKITGTGVLVDRGILDKIFDPLLHIVRNAFDHGIETPAEREKQGKLEPAQIEIRAYHQGNYTVLEVRDNGRGINHQKIAQKAIEKGLVSPRQAAVMSKESLLDFIFAPGFSTASQVSELSGRGVGLDVVREELRVLKGSVTINSTPGEGTTFLLRLPLTLTIARLLVCLDSNHAFAFAADSIQEIIVPKADQIEAKKKQKFFRWREQLIPIYRLANVLSYSCTLPASSLPKNIIPSAHPASWSSPLLLFQEDEQIFALEIERLGPEQDMVIKPFGSLLAPPSYTYGCTIWGDGTPIPVIDGFALLNQLAEQGGSLATTKQLSLAKQTNYGFTSLPGRKASILIVDDSITIRQSLLIPLKKAKYKVFEAKDGWEAMKLLQQGTDVQLIISDVEMPNMNGLELLSNLKQDAYLARIPVIMLTSRSNEKHRQLALESGAITYFNKPFIEQELLTAIAKIINLDN